MAGEEITYPEAFVISDEASMSAQRRFLLFTRIQLGLLITASGIGAISWAAGSIDVAAMIAGVGLSAAASVRFLLSRKAPHQAWYEGRAAAESLKTLAWRYAVGGQPFPIARGDVATELEDQSIDVVSGLPSIPAEAKERVAMSPTPWMARLRTASLDERAASYRRDRIQDEQHWYAAKSLWNARRARVWQAIVLTLLCSAAIGAFFKGFGLIEFDLFGIAGAAVASAAAWTETKQHATLATAYRVAAEELAAIEQLLASAQDEEVWARTVAEAEAAISREHTTWKASSSRREPVSLA